MNRSRYSDFVCLAAIVLLVMVAFAVRVVSINAQSLWRDEVDALCYAHEFPHLVVQALAPEIVGDLETRCTCPSLPITPAQSPDERVLRRLTRVLGGMIRQNGPLYFFLLRGWIAATGTSEYAMRFLSLVCGVLCVPLVYALGRRLFDRQTGLFAALLAAISPYLIWYSQEVKMYALVSALALLVIYGLRRAIEMGNWRWWAVQIIATSLASYTHILAALLIPVQVLLYFSWWPQARKQWRGALVSLACLTLPYLPLALWQAPQIFHTRETGFYHYKLGEMVQVLLDGWSLGILGLGQPWGTVLISALAVWGLTSPLFLSLPGRKRGAGTSRFALLCWLTLPLLAVWFVSLWQPLFTDRYLIWASPAFYLLIALGLASLWRWGVGGRWTVVLLSSIILAISGVNQWQQAAELTKSDFRAAAAYVAERYETGELVIFQIPHGVYTFDYYFPIQDYPWVGGLYTNHLASDGNYMMSEQSAAREMQELTAEHDVVWLIATETAMWDKRELVRTWLEANGERADEMRFKWVDVYRYVK